MASVTYSIPASAIYGFDSSNRSSTLASMGTTTNKGIGYSTNDSKYHACKFAFGSLLDEVIALRNSGRLRIDSIKLQIRCSGTFGYARTMYWGASSNTSTTSCTISASKQFQTVKNASSVTIDMTSVGIPSTKMYSAGGCTEKAAGYNGVSSATLVIVGEVTGGIRGKIFADGEMRNIKSTKVSIDGTFRNVKTSKLFLDGQWRSE